MPGYVKRGWRNLHQECLGRWNIWKSSGMKEHPGPRLYPVVLPGSPPAPDGASISTSIAYTHIHTHTLPEPPWEAWRISLFQRPEVKTERGLVSTLLRFIQFYATRWLLGNRPGLWKGYKWSLRSLPSNYLKSNWGNTNVPQKYCRFGFKSLQ